MSKYIRTKNGIYAFKEGMEIKNCYMNYTSESKPYLIFDDKKATMNILGKVIKQADTIEELCDEFIVIGYYKNRPLHFDTLLEAQKFVYENGCQDKDYIEIKGAIWTDKGLIYVAKMNNKGGLELI